MADLPDKNAPATWKSPFDQMSHLTFSFSLTSPDRQRAFFYPRNAHRPVGLVTDDRTKLTVEVTTSPHAAILDGTALWATVAMTSNYLEIQSPITAMRLTCSSGSVKADISC